MFSPQIVDSEEFLEMPGTSQALYFQLGMNADDDGFIQPGKVMRKMSASTDDLKVLIGKRFLLDCGDGVVVIKHWLVHNIIRGDRYKPTRFQDKKEALFIKENKAYTDKDPSGLHSDNQMAAQVRLGKVRLYNTFEEKNFKEKEEEPEIEESNENTDPEGKWQENSEGTQLWVPSRAWKLAHQKKTQKMIPRSFKKETFVYDDYMAKLRSATLTDKIVAFIWDEKGYHFDNLEQVKTQFGLDAPFAKKLIGYSKDQVYRAIRKAKEMGEKNGFDWKASTVVKVIADTNKI